MTESRTEIKDVQQNLSAYQRKSKKEIEDVQQNLTKVSKEIEQWNATTLQMLEKMKRIEQRVLALPSPVEIVWNSVRKDIFVAGGYPSSSLKSAEIFNWKEKKWIKFASMENGHGGASSFIKNNTLFVAGGYGCKSVDKMNLNQLPLTFQTFPGKLPCEWYAHQTVVYKQKVLYIGGFIVGKETSDIIYEVQISGNKHLEEFCHMPEPRQDHKAVVVDDKVFIFGGCAKGSQPLSSVLEFDPKIPELKEMTPLPHPLIGMATVQWRDQVVLLGGYDGSETLNNVIMYDSKTGKSMPIPSMLEKRSECCAVIIGDTIVVMGGKNDKGEVLKSVEYFTMGSSSSWDKLPLMNEPRKEAIAEVLPFEQKYV
ncbi:beta-scruin-like [Xenia sp. Carnegie-2017]|uniref:beta-scruin-like n=1 Tax=Xenia sp. Carnegie-2017 TaxID=2897299 RepID=UPI001F034942|nr:beta-scruin-like [Xenia sp. Carnegie-2017]